jgi:hypothetical protein
MSFAPNENCFLLPYSPTSTFSLDLSKLVSVISSLSLSLSLSLFTRYLIMVLIMVNVFN